MCILSILEIKNFHVLKMCEKTNIKVKAIILMKTPHDLFHIFGHG